MNANRYIAHRNESSGVVQTVKEHCENTAALCREFSIPELKDFMYAVPPPMVLMMEYCIAGHHSGVPDSGFQRRMPISQR